MLRQASVAAHRNSKSNRNTINSIRNTGKSRLIIVAASVTVIYATASLGRRPQKSPRLPDLWPASLYVRLHRENTITGGGSTAMHSKAICWQTGSYLKAGPPGTPCGAKKDILRWMLYNYDMNTVFQIAGSKAWTTVTWREGRKDPGRGRTITVFLVVIATVAIWEASQHY